MSHIYVPLDIETTGLDSKADYILEMAWAVLDDQFNVIVEPQTYIVDHGHDWTNALAVLRQAPDVVRNMHNESGLAGDLLSLGGETLEVIAQRLSSSIREAKSSRDAGAQAHLLGMSIEFDKSFMREEATLAPLLDDRMYGGIHHRSLDLTGLKLMYESLGWDLPKVENENPHRAFSDVQEAIDMARALHNDLYNLGEL